MITDLHSTSFGALLRSFRQQRNLTQQAVAEALGIHRRTLVRWEQGDYLPESKTQVLELARCLSLNDQKTRQLLEASLTALSPYWSVPLPRNPYFTGREEILEALHTQLSVEQGVALTQSSALHGLGGIGKTQIALEYAYRHALEYSAVFWIGSETDEQVVASLLRIAEALQLEEREDHDPLRVVMAVQHWLSTHCQWLLIWDNVEALDTVPRFLPGVRQGSLLLTTRRQAIGPLAQGLPVGPMGQEDGLLLLFRRAKVLAPDTHSQLQQFAQHHSVPYAAAEELVREVAGLPLALDQAGAYLEEVHCTLVSYLHLFRTQRSALLALRGESAQDHPASVSITFTLALRATVELHPAIEDLLRVCALLSPDAIPEELFHQSGTSLGVALGVSQDMLEWNRLVSLACRSSLLSRQAETQTLSIHRLVQAVVLDTMTEQEREQWQERVIVALGMAFHNADMVGEGATWKRWQRLLPHALLTFEHRNPSCHSLPLATLANNVGCFLRLQGYDAEAEPLLTCALSLFEQVLGPAHPEVASTLNNLALGFFNQGRYEEIEPLLARALSIREQAYGLHHPEVATILNNWAYILREQGKYTEARPLFERSLAIREHTLGPRDPLVARSLKNLADLCLMQGNYLRAEQYAQRALAIQEQVLGADHPQIVRTLDTLGNLLREQGKYREADLLYLRGISIWEQHLGPGHPQQALLLDDLAECSRLQQRDAQAEHLYQQSLAIREQTKGQSEVYVSIPLLGLANLARDKGHYQEAEPLYQRALRLREEYLGEHNPDTAQVIYEHALLRARQGKRSEALSLAERALSIREQTLGDTHPHTIAARALYTQLGEAQTDVGENQDAQEQKKQHGNRLQAAIERENAPPSMQAPLAFSQRGKDPFAIFLKACCEQHPRAWCRSADLWEAYLCWTQTSQERHPLSQGAFIAQLKVRGYRADRTNTVRIWRGIALVKDGS